jgi:hypothetical protein
MLSITYEPMVYDNLHKLIHSKHYIPYRILSSDTKLEEGKRYYIGYYRQTMKVLSVEYNSYGILEYCYVKWDDGCYGSYCSDIAVLEDYYIDNDIDQIYKIDDILDTNSIFTGAEILYWFFINDITALSEKYKNIWPMLDEFANNSDNDYCKFKLSGVKDDNGTYTSIKISKINTKNIISSFGNNNTDLKIPKTVIAG